jgi:hypothetical protein
MDRRRREEGDCGLDVREVGIEEGGPRRGLRGPRWDRVGLRRRARGGQARSSERREDSPIFFLHFTLFSSRDKDRDF